MGKRGPAPQPTAMKLLRGNPGKRKLNDQEPQFEAPGAVEPPEDLDGAGLAEWDDQFPRLTASGVLTAADMGGFIHYCRLVQQEEWIWKKWKDEVDTDQQLKFSMHFLKISADRRAWGSQYGITPSSRSQVKASKPKDAGAEKRRRFLGGAA